jgi:single-strand DNA-binding protein
MSFQKLIIVGRVGRDPEMRYTKSGVPVTSFSVAVDKRWNNQDGDQQEKTTWFRVTCWRKLAETAAQYLQKGKLILVEGEIDSSAYTDKQSGNARSSLEMTASNFRFLGGKGDSDDSGGAATPPARTSQPPTVRGGAGAAAGYVPDEDDGSGDIPF